MTQPLCRYCGKAIAKRTTQIWFGRSAERLSGAHIHERTERPITRAAAQKLTNGSVVSVRYSHDKSTVAQVTVWDGQTYVDSFFCKGEHARAFGYAAARAGHVMAAWQIAEARQNAIPSSGN